MEIGLLKPAAVGANGYRYYGRTEQLRLQRILFHREPGVPLNAIAGLLEVEGGDQIDVLIQHRGKLVVERDADARPEAGKRRRIVGPVTRQSVSAFPA